MPLSPLLQCQKRSDRTAEEQNESGWRALEYRDLVYISSLGEHERGKAMEGFDFLKTNCFWDF